MANEYDEILNDLRSATTQRGLDEKLAATRLSADGWRRLAVEVLGRKVRTGTYAKQLVRNHLSDNLLIEERVKAVHRSFERDRPRR